jgi:hypothetical protein
MRTSESQPDLFATTPAKEPLFYSIYEDGLPEHRRAEAYKMLEMAQEAQHFPWKNLTVATCEEMRFNALARLFPPAEGLELLEAFAAEIRRLYNLIDEPWMPLYESVLKTQCECNIG